MLPRLGYPGRYPASILGLGGVSYGLCVNTVPAMKRFTTKFLLAVTAIVSIILWATCVKTNWNISLVDQSVFNFREGDRVNVLRSPFGGLHARHYIINQEIVDRGTYDGRHFVTVRATAVTKFKHWLSGGEDLLVVTRRRR